MEGGRIGRLGICEMKMLMKIIGIGKDAGSRRDDRRETGKVNDKADRETDDIGRRGKEEEEDQAESIERQKLEG